MSDDQGALFQERLGREVPVNPQPLARTTDPDTSKAAAASMVDAAAAQRAAVLDVLRQNPGGLVHREIDTLLDWPAHTAGRRLPELRRLGLVRKAEKRATESGRLAYVYVAVP